MLGIIFLLTSFVFGSLFWHWLSKDKESSFDDDFVLILAKKIIFPFGLGMVISGYVVLLLALILKNLFAGVTFFSVFGILGISLVVLFKSKSKKILSFPNLTLFLPKRFDLANIAVFFIIAVIAILGLQSMIFDDAGYPWGILKGWGDGAYHLNMVQGLAHANPFVLDQPVAGGRILSYPFLVNFISAILLKIGFSLPWAWHLPTVIFNLGLVLGFFELGKKFFSKKKLALVFVFLVLFGAGLGYFKFFEEVKKDSQITGWTSALVKNFFEPKFEYSHLDSRTGGKPGNKNTDDNIVWIVPAISFFSHQRSFILGAFLGVMFLATLMSCDKYWLGFGINYKSLFILALLPLAHTHSFLALFILAGSLIVTSGRFLEALKNKNVWLSGALALPQIIFLFLALKLNGSQGFVPWFGWMACKHSASWFFCDLGVSGTDSSVFLFWLKNFGVIFVLWIISLFINRLKTKHFVLPSVVLFMIPNLILLQPWEFDNNKFLFWWWVLAVLLSLSLFAREEKSPGTSNEFQISKLKIRNLINHFLLAIFIFGSTFSGVIDVVYRLQPGLKIEKNSRNFGYYGEQEIELASWIKENTKPNDVFLTSTSPTQFVPMLSGRPIYLGFTGWIWTQGGGDIVRERKIKINEFVVTGNSKKLCQDGVKYWLADEAFFKEYPSSETRINGAGKEIFELGQIRIVKFDCKE